MLEQFVDRSLLHDSPLLHHRHAVADLRRDPKIVGNEQHRQVELGANLVQQRQHLRLHRNVERGHRLVGDQQLGLDRQRARNAYALPLSS